MKAMTLRRMNWVRLLPSLGLSLAKIEFIEVWRVEEKWLLSLRYLVVTFLSRWMLNIGRGVVPGGGVGMSGEDYADLVFMLVVIMMQMIR